MSYTEQFDMLSSIGNAITGAGDSLANTGSTFSSSPANFLIATAAETVSTIWNSLTPASINVNTVDWLRSVDRDAAKMLEENRESINLASMFAGTVVPAGISLKMMNLARSGLIGVGYSERLVGSSWVGSKQKALMQEIETTFREAGPATTEYKALRRKLFSANATQQILDNFVVEAAVVMGMNAHPWMEDYKENPLQNYLLGAAIGGIFGVGFSIPASKAAIRKLTGAVEREQQEAIIESGVQLVHPAFTNSAKIQAHNKNVDILDTIANDTTQPQPVRDLATSRRLQDREAAAKAFNAAVPWLEKEPATSPLRTAVLDILNDPAFLGVDQVLKFNMDRLSGYTPRQAALVKDPSSMPAGRIHWLHESLVDDKQKAETVFVRLGNKDVFAFEGIQNAAWAADIPNIKTIIADAAKRKDINLVSPVKDWTEDNLFRSRTSAQVDADHLRELAALTKIPETQIPYLTVAPDHLPRLNAIIAYADKLTPEERAALRIRVTADYPTYSAQKEFVEKTVKPTYWGDIQRTANADDVMVKLRADAPRDATAKKAVELLEGWLGSKSRRAPLVSAMNQAFTGTRTAQSGVDAAAAKLIWETGASFRQAMRAHADADGYVYLWRGSEAEKEFTHASVQSYSFDRNAAHMFGPHNKLYKIHVDNLIGSLSRGGLRSEYEIIATAPHFETVNNVPVATSVSKAVDLPEQAANTISVDGLVEQYANAVETHIKQLDSTGVFSAEEISARTNTTKDGVMLVLGGGHLKDAKTEWRRYRSIDNINEYIGDQNKLLAFRGNPSRSQMADQYSSLDRHQYRAMQQEETESFTRSSGSLVANSIADLLATEQMKLLTDTASREVAQIGRALVETPRIQSADNMVRALKDGYVFTGIGKLYINLVDGVRKVLLEPLAQPAIGIKNNPTQLVEFNMVVNKLYSMKGWRDIVEDPITGKWVILEKDDRGQVRFATKANGDTWFIQQDAVAHFINATRAPSGELKKLHDLNRKLRGQAPLNDLGLYLPPLNLVNKNYAFVIDRSHQKGTQLLIADTADELGTQINAWKSANTGAESIEILTKGQTEADALARHYQVGDMYVTYANVAEQHTGVASLALLPTDTRLLENILQGYETSVIQSSRAYTSHYLRDTVGWLDTLSEHFSSLTRDQPKRGLNKETINNPAESIRNVLLGQDQLQQSVGLQEANNYTEFLINSGLSKIDKFVSTARLDPTNHRDYFDKLNAELRAVGITESPFASFQTYLAANIRETKNLAPGLVSAASGLTATMGLRFMEMANAAVNIMSVPIMTWSALMERLPATPIQNSTGSVTFPLRIMMDGIRHMYSPQGRALEQGFWEPKGLIDQVLRQFEDSVTALNRAQLGKGASENAIAAMHSITNNKGFISLLSTPSDWAEKFTRRFAMHTGYMGAKHAYPGIDDTAATLAAMHFADRTVGNYHAHQRPTIFQGTLGATVGLYQTYMLTYAQHVYRSLEERNFKQLASLMLVQAGIFGTKSLPGYNLLSEHIVSHFNNDQWDLTTGVYRAVGDPLAEVALYGLPSSITGAAFYTRGDITPRIPSTATDLAVLNAAIQGYGLVTNTISKISQGAQDGFITRNFLEALSLQSLSRPVARWSEILTGTSQTSQGNTVSTQDEVWTPIGVAARMLGARPLEEQVTRETIHLNKFYEQRDFENRQRAMSAVKTALRGGDLDDAVLSRVAFDYMRQGGTAKGWKAVMNDTLIHADLGARMDLKRKLEPTSPLHTMIGDFF